ncbi:MAG: hypothetical protein QF464_19945, partial [Myxococcota bacterium]|nr:hypothetical protein [Myxococcota bacterium]
MTCGLLTALAAMSGCGGEVAGPEDVAGADAPRFGVHEVAEGPEVTAVSDAPGEVAAPDAVVGPDAVAGPGDAPEAVD